jgi:hypothetical protein
MPDTKQHLTCMVELKVGGEELALRRFHTTDEAVTWLMGTAAKLRGAVDAELMDKIAEKFAVSVAATITEDAHSDRVPVFSGSLRGAEDRLIAAVKEFETTGRAAFHEAAVKAGQERRGRRVLKQVAIAFGGALAITLGYFGIKALPPLFDIDALGGRLLSAPPANFAGAWRPAGSNDGCEASRVEFQRAQFDMLAAGRLRSYSASFDTPNAWTLRVEYSDAGVRISQTYRLTEELASLQLVAVTASDPEVQSAARRLVGARFVRCAK